MIDTRVPEWETRLRIELEELQGRLNKLSIFVDGEVFTSLSFTEQRLLSAQYGAMMAYEQILVVRLGII